MTASLALRFPVFSFPVRKFFNALLAAFLCVCLVGAGCAAADEFISLLTAIEPAAEGIVGIVCLVEAPACAAATSAMATYKTASAAVTQAYHDWQNADAAQQPGKLGALQAAITTAQNDFQLLETAAHINNPTRQAAINAIAQSVTGELTNLLSLVEQTKAAGGTTTAAVATSSTQQVHHARRQRHLRYARAEQFKADLRAKLAVKTGDAQLDAVNAKTAANLK